MTQRIKEYMNYIDSILAAPEAASLPLSDIITEHEKQLSFFMHERLVHLLVMLTFALLTFGTFFAMLFDFSPSLLALFVAFMVLLVPYILHYFLLENSVQYMYDQYDDLKALQGQGYFTMKGKKNYRRKTSL